MLRACGCCSNPSCGVQTIAESRELRNPSGGGSPVAASRHVACACCHLDASGLSRPEVVAWFAISTLAIAPPHPPTPPVFAFSWMLGACGCCSNCCRILTVAESKQVQTPSFGILTVAEFQVAEPRCSGGIPVSEA